MYICIYAHTSPPYAPAIAVAGKQKPDRYQDRQAVKQAGKLTDRQTDRKDRPSPVESETRGQGTGDHGLGPG